MSERRSIVDAANLLLKYAAIRCAECSHPSSQHSDIGTCEACDCLCFEEPGEVQ